MRTRKKPRGHLCWCCGRVRANERFSGRGHARHLCKECSKLGKEEHAYRQAVRDIDGLLDWNGVVRRKQQKSFERFLLHPDERVRRYAEEVAAEDARAREAFRRERITLEAEELRREKKLEECAAVPGLDASVVDQAVSGLPDDAGDGGCRSR